MLGALLTEGAVVVGRCCYVDSYVEYWVQLMVAIFYPHLHYRNFHFVGYKIDKIVKVAKACLSS